MRHPTPAELQRLRTEVAEWKKLRDPVTLHVSLLRGFPAKLDRATFLHLAGDETPNGALTRLAEGESDVERGVMPL